MVVYFILNIKELGLGVKDFVRAVEGACMKALATFGIKAERDKEYPGLWVNGKKIVAVGFHISNNVSMHGIALNVDPNMEHYKHIVPCGIKDRGVTSMKELTGSTVALNDVITSFQTAICDQFN